MGFIKVVKSWKIWLSDLLWELDCSSTRKNSGSSRSSWQWRSLWEMVVVEEVVVEEYEW